MTVIPVSGRQNKINGARPHVNVVAAIDIGSSKISCLIAEVVPQKSSSGPDARQNLKVIGVGQTATRGISSGSVTDIHQAECAIRLAVDTAERMARTSITKIFVAIGGGRPSTSSFEGKVKCKSQVVGQADLDFALVQALNQVAIGKRCILHLTPTNFTLDGVSKIEKPMGLHGEELQSEIAVTTVDPTYLRNITTALSRAHLDVAGFILSSFAAAKAALTTDEADLGTVVIDLGGAITSIAFVRGGKLVAADTVNLGGQHITQDIAQGLSTSVAHSERMKTLWGTVLAGGHGDREMLAVPILGEKGADSVTRVPKSMLTNILRARYEEMFELCGTRLAKPGFACAMGAKIVLTGGASQIPGLRDLAAHVLQRPVRNGFALPLAGLMESEHHAGMAVVTGSLAYALRPDPHYAVPENAEENMAVARMGYPRRVMRWLAGAF